MILTSLDFFTLDKDSDFSHFFENRAKLKIPYENSLFYIYQSSNRE